MLSAGSAASGASQSDGSCLAECYSRTWPATHSAVCYVAGCACRSLLFSRWKQRYRLNTLIVDEFFFYIIAYQLAIIDDYILNNSLQHTCRLSLVSLGLLALDTSQALTSLHWILLKLLLPCIGYFSYIISTGLCTCM